MKRKLYTKEEVTNFILDGKIMVLTADEKILDSLPKGNWIGGISPYFMNDDKGIYSTDKIFVDDFTSLAINIKIEKYSKNNIQNIALDSFYNGFTLLIIPIDTEVFKEYAFQSLSFKNIFNNPITGYVAGQDVKKGGPAKPAVYNGLTKSKIINDAIAMHIELPSNKLARVEILNLDSIDKSSPKIQFPKTDFTQSECTIDGVKMNIAEYFTNNKYKDLPIIANNNGALINKDIKLVDTDSKEVSFFAPIYNDEIYYLANKNSDYYKLFEKRLRIDKSSPYSCICVSYYLNGNLEGKKIDIESVFAFGEIAFQLLNRTIVYIEIDEI